TVIPGWASNRASNPARIMDWSSTISTRTGWASPPVSETMGPTYRHEPCPTYPCRRACPAGALALPPKLPARVKGWRLKSLCGVTRNDEVEPTVQAMASDSPSRGAALRRPRGLRNRVRRLGRDYLYILPGLPLAAVSLSVLVVLTLVSVGTVVIWAGALLMPVTLLLASNFANLSRRRLQDWGLPPVPVTYLPRGQGPMGLMRLMADPRRWLDLAFETVLAFPVR